MTDAATRLRAVPAAVVSDVLDGLGLRDQLLPHGIGPLLPGQTVCGPAFPIAGRTDAETAPEAGLRGYLEMLGHVPHGHVVVMAAGDETAAHFGELSATWVQARDCPGVVIDCGLRDIPVLRGMGYPIFHRYHSTRSIAGRWSPVSMGEPVEIGGVRIAQGDLIVGDDDGVIVIPAAEAAASLVGGRAVEADEAKRRAAILAGGAR